MSMYVDVLSGALEAWRDAPSGDALIDHVVACRAQLTAMNSQGRSARDFLAAEVAYDRALIRLCNNVRIAADVAAFVDPSSERSRLESLLTARAAIDLSALSRSRVADSRR